MKTLKLVVTATGKDYTDRHDLPVIFDEKEEAIKRAIEASKLIQYNSDRQLTDDYSTWESFEDWEKREGESAGKILLGAHDDYSRMITSDMPSTTGGRFEYIITVIEEEED